MGINKMTDQQPTSMTSNKESGPLTVMTFYIEDSLYAIPIENVVSLSKETDNIQELPVKSPGLIGVSHYQNQVVPVVDVSQRIGVKSGIEAKQGLIDTLTAREQDHIDWLDALEKSILTGEKFSKARDPHQCAFGKWFDAFDTRNEALQEIMAQFDSPHQQIHSLADKLLNMREKGEQEKALKELEFQRITTLRRLRSLFQHAREQLREMMRPILLYVTCNGTSPAYALLIDEVHDALTYDRKDCYSPERAGFHTLIVEDQYIKAILTNKKQPNSILLDTNQILDQNSQSMPEEAIA